MAVHRRNLDWLKNTQTSGARTTVIPFKRDILFTEKKMIKKIKMKILLWIQGWSGQLNSWAWTKWDKLHREDWVKGYEKHKKKFHAKAIDGYGE